MSDIKVGDKVLWDFGDCDVTVIEEIDKTHVLVRFDNDFTVWVAKTELTRVNESDLVIRDLVDDYMFAVGQAGDLGGVEIL